nr:transposase domain-containing protein [Lentilactobacillus hilgardii]
MLNTEAIDWSNNAAERAMKNIVIGRKNWLFSTSPQRARANAIWMTLIESAKACGLDPQKYLQTLLTELPQLPVFAKKEVLEAYLPWN